jgi:uncharacterized membrane protein YjgN (DUF898 family)
MPERDSDPGAAFGEQPSGHSQARALLPFVIASLASDLVPVGGYWSRAKSWVRRRLILRKPSPDGRREHEDPRSRPILGLLIALAVFGIVAIYFEALIAFARGLELGWIVLVRLSCFAFFFYLFQMGVYRRYRRPLTRTSWRGIRGIQTGSEAEFAIRALFYWLLIALTLGLAYPLMRDRLQAYRINNTCFGNETFQYTRGADRLFRFWILPWSLLVGMLIASTLQSAQQVPLGEGSSLVESLGSMRQVSAGLIQSAGPTLALGFAAFCLAMFWYRGAEIRHFTDHTNFQDFRFTSSLSGFQILLAHLLYGTFLLLPVAVLIVVSAVSIEAFRISTGLAEITTLAQLIAGIVITAGLVLGAVLLKPIIVQNRLFRVFCANLRIFGNL